MKSNDDYPATELHEDITSDTEDLASELEQAQKHLYFLERELDFLERENQRPGRTRIRKLRRLGKSQ
jgi:hypothetical protein